MKMSEQALAYLGRGWSILPIHTIHNGLCTCGNVECGTPGKHPRIKWAEFTKRLPTKDEVVSWFTVEYPNSNIGVVTGLISHLAVVDCDGPVGIKSVEPLHLPPTLTSRSGGGGLHMFYGLGSQTLPTKIGILPKVDLKAEKGYVVLPPSLHRSGRRYQWIDTRMMAGCDLTKVFPVKVEVPEPNGHLWFEELLDGVDEGERSRDAAKLAGRYFTLGMSVKEVLMMMCTWNIRNRPPISSRDLRATIMSIYDKHKQHAKPQNVETLGDIFKVVAEYERRKHGSSSEAGQSEKQ